MTLDSTYGCKKKIQQSYCFSINIKNCHYKGKECVNVKTLVCIFTF